MDNLHATVELAAAISPGRVSARAVRRAVQIVRAEDDHVRNSAPAPLPSSEDIRRARRADREARRADGDPRAELAGHEDDNSTAGGSRRRARCRCPGEDAEQGADALAELARWIRWGCGLHDDRRAARRAVGRLLEGARS